jgi:superfamily I DNA/RNA helicase
LDAYRKWWHTTDTSRLFKLQIPELNTFKVGSRYQEWNKAKTSESNLIFVRGGAGTGKSKLLLERVFHLIAHKGIDPEKIHCLAYTNDNNREILERYDKEIESQKLDDDSGKLHPTFSTFTSWCGNILKEFCPEYSQHTYISSNYKKDNERLNLLKTLAMFP